MVMAAMITNMQDLYDIYNNYKVEDSTTGKHKSLLML